MKREDYMFTIGYQGDTAIVDGGAKHRYGRMSVQELAEAGLFKAALSAALYSGDLAEIETVTKLFREKADVPSLTTDQIKRTLGVFGVSPGIYKVKII